jgi:hypothetical protein
VCLEHAEEQGRLYVYTTVMPLPGGDAARLTLFTHMLQLAFLDHRGEEGTLAIHRDAVTCHVGLAISGLKVQHLERTLQRLIAARKALSGTLHEAMAGRRENTGMKAKRSVSSLPGLSLPAQKSQ